MSDPLTDEPLRGEFFDGITAAGIPVTVALDAAGSLHIRGVEFEQSAEFSKCEISPALGRMPRGITLPGGATIETVDFERLAEWERRHKRGTAGQFIHAIESRWRFAALAVAVLVLVSLAAYFWGIPAAARAIAFRIPPAMNTTLSEHTLSAIERLLGLKPSELTPERQTALRGEFERMVADLGSAGFRYAILFRSSPMAGANAFALPSGTILVTDELVKLAGCDEEILAVLAHEITHVEQRHGMRSVLQNSGVFFLLGTLFGDLTSITALGASLPTVFAEAGYSRNFEREADRGAADYCRRRGWGTGPLRTMLDRLGKEHPEVKGANWISSHPETDERIRALRD